MSTTVVTVETALAKSLKDPNLTFFSEDELRQAIKSVANNETTFTLPRLRAGNWCMRSKLPFVVFGPEDATPGFTEASGCTYKLWLGSGLNSVQLELLTGSDDRAQIRLTGCRVDYVEAQCACLLHLANHKAQEYSQAIGGNAISPQTARAELIKQIESLRGCRGI